MRTRILAVLAAALSAVSCSGGGGKDSGAGSYPTGTNPTPTNIPANTMIATKQLSFNPATITVLKGVAVAFVFEDSTHNIYFTGANKPADIPESANTTVQRTFSSAGGYGVYCKIHPYMSGFITVQ